MLRRLLPFAAALALVAGGCGDDDKDKNKTGTTAAPAVETKAYQTQVQTILGSVGAAGTALGASARTSNSTQDLARALETFQGSVEQAANKLKALNGPDSASEGQDELEQVLREIASGVQPSIEAAKTGDRAKFQRTFRVYQRRLDGEFRQRLTAAGEKIDRALAGQ